MAFDAIAAAVGMFPITKDKLATIKSDYANWVIPGKLMCGPYPGYDGWNFGTLESAKAHLRGLLDDGIDTFVCLQEELALVDQGQSHVHFPKFENYKETLRGMLTAAEFAKITFLYMPMRDQTAPGDYKKFVGDIKQICDGLMQGRRVYVHCAGGHGRTGVYVCGILLAIYKNVPSAFDADFIMTYVQFAHDKRRIMDARNAALLVVQTPNTSAQRDFVRQFHTYLRFV